MVSLPDIDLSDKRTLYIVIGAATGLFLIFMGVCLSCCILCGRRKKRNAASAKRLPQYQTTKQQQVAPSKKSASNNSKIMNNTSERTDSTGRSSGGAQQLTTEIIVEHDEDDVSTLGCDFDLKDYPGAASILGMALERQGSAADMSIAESIRDLIAASTVGGDVSTKDDNRYVAKAPPGKLGMVIDTAEMDRCPYVHTIKAESVLIDQVRPGDRLLTVNGHDVTGLTALEVSRLIARLDPEESRIFELERYLQWSEDENWYRNSV